MNASFEHLRVERRDRIAVVTIDRPPVNALNDGTVGEIDRCFELLAADDDVALIILTGGGDKAFVAGADIEELEKQDSVSRQARALRGQAAFTRIERMRKPVIAAVNGFALGGGCELALACHLRYASAKARLGLPEVSLGIIPGYGGTQRLARLVGPGRALEWILTGEMIPAEEAYRIGLVNGVCEPGELLTHVEGIARKILTRGPVALGYALEAVYRGGDSSLDEGLALEAELFGLVSATRDMKEGTRAFLEKRSPEFTGE